MKSKKLLIGAAFLAVAALATTAGAVSDSIYCDEYHNGGGMNADCANYVIFLQEIGRLGD